MARKNETTNLKPKNGFSGNPKSRPSRSGVGCDKHEEAPKRKCKGKVPDKIGNTLLIELNVKGILSLYVSAVERLYECSCNEKLMLRLDVSCTMNDGISTAKAMLCSSRVEADGKEFKNGIISERKWHEVLSLARSFNDADEFDSGKFCTTFIERCMSLFTNRKALVRALNVRRRKKILWFQL